MVYVNLISCSPIHQTIFSEQPVCEPNLTSYFRNKFLRKFLSKCLQSDEMKFKNILTKFLIAVMSGRTSRRERALSPNFKL